eukprot:745853-Hanusia_phi.AAC.6
MFPVILVSTCSGSNTQMTGILVVNLLARNVRSWVLERSSVDLMPPDMRSGRGGIGLKRASTYGLN